MQSQKKKFKDPIGLFITIETASKYSHMTAASFIHLIKSGNITPRDKINPNDLDDLRHDKIISLSKQIYIPLYHLPDFAVINYLKDVYAKESFFSVDLLAYKNKYGSMDRLYKDIEIMKKIEDYTKYFYSDRKIKEKLYSQASFSRASYMREKGEIMSSDLRKLLNPPTQRNFRTICPCARDYLRGRLFTEPVDSTELFDDLVREKEIKGTEMCEKCIHNPRSTMYQQGLNDRATYYPDVPEEICMMPGNGMIIPESVVTINDYKKSLSPSLLFYARYGRKNWTSSFAYKNIRIKPRKVNEVVFGDHHIVDVLLVAGYDKLTNLPILKKPCITAMMDAATKALIGSVVSFHPNQDTIAESFCRAVTISPNSPFYGLPEVFYTDNGTDYCSKLIEGTDKGSQQRIETEKYTERAFMSNPLLVALNVSARHATTAYPWVKPIEPVFRILDRKWFRRIPGYVGNDKRPIKEIKRSNEFIRLRKRNALWDLEKFSDYWFNYVVPCYNNTKYRNRKSPLEKYLSYPRANTITPDWPTLAILKTQRPEYTVHQRGISYHGRFYNHPSLHNYIGKKVTIYNFNTEFEHSLSVFYINKEQGINTYVCEATPSDQLEYIEEDKMKLARALIIAKEQEREVRENVICIRRASKLQNLDNSQYIDYNSDLKKVFSTEYAEKIDINLTDERVTVLCHDALKAIKAQNNTINQLIDAYLSRSI